MSWIQNLPIKRTISLVIVLTCSLVLLLACSILAGYEVFEFRGALLRDTGALADVLAKNSRAALAFQDEAAARETMQALRAEPSVVAACLYTADGSAVRQLYAFRRRQIPGEPRPGRASLRPRPAWSSSVRCCSTAGAPARSTCRPAWR